MQQLRANTAVDVLIGPFVDATDGKTAETGLTLDVELSKLGQALANKNDATTPVHDAAGTIDGHYNCVLDATDTDTEGTLVLLAFDSAALIVRHEYMVMAEAAWDSMFVAKDSGFMEVALTAGTVNDASLGGGLEIVFETDFGTNYNITRNAWATNVQDSVGTGNLTADVIAISGDTTAADNLELMYDTTGYTDPTAPASRSQVDAVGASSGGSVHISATEDNTSGSIDPGSTTKVWATVSGTFANTEADNGSQHDFTDTGDDISHVYGFQVGGGRTATAVDVIANVDGNNDIIQVEVWDHVGADWEIIGTIDGSGGTVYKVLDLPLLLKHTGTSASEIGKVYIQLDTNSTTPSDLSVELILVSAVNIGQTVGYEGGAIWINTGASNTNTESFVDGVADNPVSTIAAAKTISTNTGLGDFHIINGSTITLAESTANESYFGDNWTLALNNQACGGAHFEGPTVSGIQTGSNCGFHGGEVGTITIADDAHFEEMGLSATITLPAGAVEFTSCHHDGSSTPILDYGAVGDTTVHMHDYHGAIEVHNMGDSGTDILHLDGHGVLTVNANGAGGTVHLKGTWKVTNTNATINFSDETVDINDILTDTADIQPNYATSTVLGRVETDTQDIQSRLPTALVSSRMDSTVDATGMESGAVSNILTTQMTESYASDGSAPTLAQSLMQIQQMLMEKNVASTTVTVKKVDGSTTAFTLTLDDATSPTSITRAT